MSCKTTTINGLRICSKCGVSKPLDYFYRTKKGYFEPYCGDCKRTIQREWSRNNKDKIKNYKKTFYPYDWIKRRDYWFKRKYGITASDFERMLSSQDNSCAICNTKDSGKRNFVIDHCHTTGVVRGILCSRCNTMLGFSKDNEETLRNAIIYLNKSRRQP